MNALRSGMSSIECAPPVVVEVLELCEQARVLSKG